MARINEKIKLGQTKEITEPGKEDNGKPRSAKVIDLAELLRKSLAEKGGAPRRKEPRKAAATSAKPALRVVSSSRGATKATARRKRA